MGLLSNLLVRVEDAQHNAIIDAGAARLDVIDAEFNGARIDTGPGVELLVDAVDRWEIADMDAAALGAVKSGLKWLIGK